MICIRHSMKVAVVMNRMTRQVLKPVIRRRRTSGRNR